MGKGRDTRTEILRQAVDLTSEVGLEGLSIGMLAGEVGMSKSGLYAHFDSKEELQCRVLDTAVDRFVATVLRPALSRPRGLPRLERLFELWQMWESEELRGGCPIIAAAAEFDDRPGPVRDRLRQHLSDLLEAIARSASIAVEEGHFRADLETVQFAFDLWGILLSYHQFVRLLDRPDARERARRAFGALVEAAGPRPVSG